LNSSRLKIASLFRRLIELRRAPEDQWQWPGAAHSDSEQLLVVRDWVLQPDFVKFAEEMIPGCRYPNHPSQAWNQSAVPHAPALLANLKESKVGELRQFLTLLRAAGGAAGKAQIQQTIIEDKVLLVTGYDFLSISFYTLL
jgi:hypothetical protein